MNIFQKQRLEKLRAKHGEECVSFNPILGTITIHPYRKDERYRELSTLLPDYDAHLIDRIYLHDTSDIEQSDAFYNAIAENYSPQTASKAFTLLAIKNINHKETA